MAVLDRIQTAQRETIPHEDLSPYAGQWVALRDGHVVASDIDAVALRANPEVGEDDMLVPVPRDGSAILIL
jgi:hypothetical protein